MSAPDFTDPTDYYDGPTPPPWVEDEDQARAELELEDRLAFNREVSDELRRLRVRDAAREAHRRQTEPEAPPFDAGTLGELLARPAEPEARVEGLIPWESSSLLTAMRKTGKTTMSLNLARSLLTGEDFLGRFGVRKLAGNIGLLNYEVSGGMIARWADDHGVDRDRLYVVNLRGRRNPLAHPEDREQLAGALRAHDVEAMIVDPFGRAYTGASQNDSGEVGAWLANLDRFARGEVGALDLLLTAHAGWNGERTRGASALEDWADVILTLTRDQDDESQRFLRAMGRLGDLDEDRLDFDPFERRLTLAGVGSRKKVKEDGRNAELAVLVVRAAYLQPGLNGRELVEAVRGMDDAPTFQDRDVSKAATYAERQGLLRIENAGKGKPKRHYATDLGTPSNPVQTPSGTDTPTPSTPSIYGRGGGRGTSDVDPVHKGESA